MNILLHTLLLDVPCVSFCVKQVRKNLPKKELLHTYFSPTFNKIHKRKKYDSQIVTFMHFLKSDILQIIFYSRLLHLR